MDNNSNYSIFEPCITGYFDTSSVTNRTPNCLGNFFVNLACSVSNCIACSRIISNSATDCVKCSGSKILYINAVDGSYNCVDSCPGGTLLQITSNQCESI